jgi:hypothetical protein
MSHLPWPSAVADVSVSETIQIQAIAWLKADARITALVGTRIYTNVPVNTAFPLLLLEGFVPGPANRLRGYGFVVSFQARAQSQKAGPYEADRIADRVIQVLTDRDGALPPFRHARWAFEASPATYTDELAGVKTYHRPTIVRVEVVG